MAAMKMFVMLLAAPLLGSAVPNLSCVVNSAPAPSALMTVNADVENRADAGFASTARLFFSTDSQATWTERRMDRLLVPGYDSTYERAFALPPGGRVYYYVRGESEANYATQSPFNAGNDWPPGDNLIAPLANEPSGDANDPEGNWLDLTGAFVGYSADRFYAVLRNNHTSWPLYSFPQPWYIYSLGFVNPAAPSDTWIFTLSHASIPGVFTNGLYLINRFTADYTRIADIEIQTSGNLLFMRVNVSDLVGHPRFGPWPNAQGFLHAAATTQAIYPIGGSRLRDTTNGAKFFVRTPQVLVGRNSAPGLLDSRVTPDTGSPQTRFRFTVRYFDADSNLPVRRRLYIDADTFDPVPDQHQYWLGVEFERVVSGFAPGWHRFRFEFDDGMSQVSTAPDSFEVYGTGLAEAVGATKVDLDLRANPNPFRDRVRLSWIAPVGTERVDLCVRDAAGRLVRRLRSDGTWCLWDGSDEQRRDLPAGAYWVTATRGPAPVSTVRVLLRR